MKSDLRVELTRRLIKEALLRTLETKTISGITISELCTNAGINRATFYNHYENPLMVMKEIAYDYASVLQSTYYNAVNGGATKKGAIEECLKLLYVRKNEIKLLFSDNAENCISGFGLNIVMDDLDKKKLTVSDDYYLKAIITSSAAFGLIQVWLTQDIKKTPRQIVEIITQTVNADLLE